MLVTWFTFFQIVEILSEIQDIDFSLDPLEKQVGDDIISSKAKNLMVAVLTLMSWKHFTKPLPNLVLLLQEQPFGREGL